ncbi:hypothetical protein CDA56_02840 [Klebsiella michiganensis]|uniref:Uncharacterized protein n=1 Tax=Klebsiella michiganensis TaxID=1134687 RepID=A0A2J4ZTN8_9ENTR|nr:hypothetical protein [Klebsiella michiganensis]MBX4799275.1 hypothetical protein [Klebsiella michiganensis]MBX4818313.1 hypothetical protein [Klebsiella michiganensis]PLM66360.1 hypothetical protein CWM85_08785 [Klebsiella michiganensis]POT65858.1 hypothetical protein C3378_29740 [Klebsiella michiganensis]
MLTAFSRPSHIVSYAAGDSLICRRDASRMIVCNKRRVLLFCNGLLCYFIENINRRIRSHDA